MASGNDLRIGLKKETTYGTRVAPDFFFEVTDDNLTYEYEKYRSAGLGGGRWRAREIQTTSAGGGTLPMEVPTVGFGKILDLLHGNTVTPVVQGATIAYKQTHTLDTPPSKTVTIQKQTPPVSTSTLLPLDYVGCMLAGWEFGMDPAAVLTFTPTFVVRELKTDQTLATYVAPAASNLLSFKGGSVTIGGVAEANIVGGVTVTGGVSLRDDAFKLGTTGLMAKPVETAKPTAGGSFTADFEDLTNLNRTVNATNADVVLLFEGATIATIYKETVKITIPGCSFTSAAPTVGGPGVVQQEVAFANASSTAVAPFIEYISTDVTV